MHLGKGEKPLLGSRMTSFMATMNYRRWIQRSKNRMNTIRRPLSSIETQSWVFRANRIRKISSKWRTNRIRNNLMLRLVHMNLLILQNWINSLERKRIPIKERQVSLWLSMIRWVIWWSTFKIAPKYFRNRRNRSNWKDS